MQHKASSLFLLRVADSDRVHILSLLQTQVKACVQMLLLINIYAAEKPFGESVMVIRSE